MDKTEMYVRMADCEEVQGQWEPQKGDYIANNEESWKKTSKDSKTRIVKPIGVLILDSPNQIDRKDLAIWLPTQDQIQGMIREYWAEKLKNKRPKDEWFPGGVIGLTYVLDTFLAWTVQNTSITQESKSFEELWLKYYMWLKFEKTWDGEKWIKSK